MSALQQTINREVKASESDSGKYTADGKGDEHLTRTGKIEKRLSELAEIKALKELYGE